MGDVVTEVINCPASLKTISMETVLGLCEGGVFKDPWVAFHGARVAVTYSDSQYVSTQKARETLCRYAIHGMMFFLHWVELAQPSAEARPDRIVVMNVLTRATRGVSSCAVQYTPELSANPRSCLLADVRDLPLTDRSKKISRETNCSCCKFKSGRSKIALCPCCHMAVCDSCCSFPVVQDDGATIRVCTRCYGSSPKVCLPRWSNYRRCPLAKQPRGGICEAGGKGRSRLSMAFFRMGVGRRA